MTHKYSMLLNLPAPHHERMVKAMKRDKQNNKTAFVLSALDSFCGEKEGESNIGELQRLVSVLAETIQHDREKAKHRHTEVMAWLDTLAEAICETDDDYDNFLKTVAKKIQTRGTK